MQALSDGADIVALLRQIIHKRGENTLDEYSSTSDFAEVFLFFDYDFQNKNENLTVDELNLQVKKMLEYFNEETENGKLYINYPMVEAIRYTKELPDTDYYTYEVSRKYCCEFKRLVQQFSFYGNFDFITPQRAKWEGTAVSLKQNWLYLIDQNVRKANYICHGENVYPECKEAIAQPQIFSAQVSKYVSKPDCMVAVLSAFPLFAYDYVKIGNLLAEANFDIPL
ncbi:MAG: hypothetical protein LUC44_00015 [Prevotellaceae bacterium]|nr:hypothetical protein [Prevotellaceae bacterium]